MFLVFYRNTEGESPSPGGHSPPSGPVASEADLGLDVRLPPPSAGSAAV